MERTISGVIGKGSVSHNTRAFTAKNVDKERSRDNVEFCHLDIKEVYHTLFDEALERYNAKQKRKDRIIEDYYEKIRQGRQEKLFHEVIFQVGNKDDMSAKGGEGQLAKKILTEFMQNFQSRNPNLFVFSAHLHMDEETPHLHIDFVPFIRNSRRGLDTRVSLKGALAEQGFHGGTRSNTEWNQWMESEKQELSKTAEKYGVQWKHLGTHNKHLSVLNFEKQERAKEVADLEKQIGISETALQEVNRIVDSRLDRAEELAEIREQLQEKKDRLQAELSELEQAKEETEQSHARLSEKNLLLQDENADLKEEKERLQKELNSMADTKMKLERDVRTYDEDEKWQLPETGLFTNVKSYREHKVKPLLTKLKELVKKLTIQCICLTDQVEKLTEKGKKQAADIQWYQGKVREQADKISQLQKQAEDLRQIKHYLGTEKAQDIIDSVKEIERLDKEQKRLQRTYDRGYSI